MPTGDPGEAAAAIAARPRSWMRAILRLIAVVVINVGLMLAYALSLGPLRRFRRPLQVLWCRSLCHVAGLRLNVRGTPRRSGATLFVANHVSYLDVPVISRDADCTFIAKAEVAGWPLFGHAARLTGTIFVQRVGTDAKAQSRRLQARLLGGENLMLFPEGTSTDGSRVAPFKSTLFAIAERLPPDVDLAVQPIAVTYARALDGTPLIGALRELYCWFGDATMFPHLVRMLSLTGCEVELNFLDPIPVAGLGRKELARRAESAVATAVAAANAALLPAPTKPSPLHRPVTAVG